MKTIIETVVEEGNKHAFTNFWLFTGSKVNHSIRVAHPENGMNLINTVKKEGDLIVITTDIVGQIEGKSYLIMSKEEWDYISGLGIRGGMKDSEAFREAFMKELDNIISAAFITKISEAFSLSIFGASPVLHPAISNNSVSDYLKNELSSNSEYYISVAELSCSQEGIRPLFVWAFSNPLLKKTEKETTSQTIL